MNKDKNIEQLMQKAIAGDSKAYGHVLTLAAQILRSFLSKRLQDENEVDDVLQEILISLHKNRHMYDGMRPFKPWLFSIAKHRLLDHLRKHYADKLRFASDLSEINDADYTTIDELALATGSINAEIEQLPIKQAQILRMIHHEGYTAKEVALKMDMNESAIKVAAHRAYKILRNKLVR